jgi:hypothetical protein
LVGKREEKRSLRTQDPLEAKQRRTVSGGKPVKFDELIGGWAAEKRPAEKIIYEWKRGTRRA